MSRAIKVRGVSIDVTAGAAVGTIKKAMGQRTYQAANELINATILVLRGKRSGRSYRVPGTRRSYTASAPGEPPAVRTGAFRMSWQPKARISGNNYISSVESDIQAGRYVLGEILENGTPGGKMKPRPHHDRIRERAEPEIVKIYSRAYF